MDKALERKLFQVPKDKPLPVVIHLPFETVLDCILMVILKNRYKITDFLELEEFQKRLVGFSLKNSEYK
jgi:hypothetical protein